MTDYTITYTPSSGGKQKRATVSAETPSGAVKVASKRVKGFPQIPYLVQPWEAGLWRGDSSWWPVFIREAV